MGLDMYLYSLDKESVLNDFQHQGTLRTEIAYWRKDYALHEIMASIWIQRKLKVGEAVLGEDFNCTPPADL